MPKNDSILVWFNKSEKEQQLRKRIRERCEFISESAFMKEAAKEKLDREDMLKKLETGSYFPTFTETTNKEEDDIDSFLDGI